MEVSMLQEEKKDNLAEDANEETSNIEVEEEDIIDLDEEASQADEEAEESNDEITRLQTENEQLNDRLLRLQAEFENFKRRTEKERINLRKYQSQNIVEQLLPVLDNFERALQVEVSEEAKTMMEGIEMVYNQLVAALEAEEVKPIDTVNEPFDPNYHHAVMQTEDETIESNIVVEELQKGYLLKDKVIRPAMVKVNK